MRKAMSESAPSALPPTLPVILSKKEVAKLLLVSEQCVYAMTRRRSKARLPHFKAVKYLRFEQGAITKWITDEQERKAAA